MITPQEIREKAFETMLFKGYNVDMVDEYMETLAEEVSALQTEIMTLKTKMKVLVDKIEDYRNNQDAISNSLVQAYQISARTESDARTRAASIVAEAEAKSAAILGDIDDRIAREEARLQEAKIATAKFFDSVRTLCQRQLTSLDALGLSSAAVKPAVSSDAMRIQNAEIIGKADAPSDAAIEPDDTRVFPVGKDA